jgi:hypothetical protein
VSLALPALEVAEPFSKHPVTVIVSAEVFVALLAVVLGVCAITPKVVAHTIAAAITIVRFMSRHLLNVNVVHEGYRHGERTVEIDYLRPSGRRR